MVTASDILDEVQLKLNDDGAIWARTELLRWLEDGYRLILSQTHAAKTFKAMGLPPRHTYAISYDWEARYVQGGSYRKFTHTNRSGNIETTFHWEEAVLNGQTPPNSDINVTQLWELAYATDDVEGHYRLFFPRHHDQLHGLWWDHKRLEPTSVRELDDLEDSWWKLQGEPYFFTRGMGPDNTVEVYEIKTAYQQGYHLRNADFPGMPRDAVGGNRTYSINNDAVWDYAYSIDGEAILQNSLTGTGYRFTQAAVNGLHGTQVWEKELQEGVDSADFTAGTTVGTYPWEVEFGAQEVNIPLGALRNIKSPNRQYFPENQWSAVGIMRNIESSEDQFLIWHSVIPQRGSMTEATVLDMLHDRILKKYLKYYVLFRAFGRQGEGYDAFFSTHYEQRFGRAFTLMTRLGTVGQRDHHYERTPSSRKSRGVARPRLPSNFPRTRYWGV